MKRTVKRKIGDIGEEVVCKYLEKRGYTIAGRNYLKPWSEIDIIANKGDLLVFVEVKSVTREPLVGGGGEVSREMFKPEDNMHPAKLKRLHRAVQTYLLDHKVPESRPWQIDLACVYLDFKSRKAKVELYENLIL